MNHKLFVYGTLRPGHAPLEIADVVSRLEPLGEGYIRGTRYELEDYPAVTNGKSRERVAGQIFRVPDDPEIFRQLDAYEEFDPQNPDRSLFRRSKKIVTRNNGSRELCWVYTYNRPIPRSAVLLKSFAKS